MGGLVGLGTPRQGGPGWGLNTSSVAMFTHHSVTCEHGLAPRALPTSWGGGGHLRRPPLRSSLAQGELEFVFRRRRQSRMCALRAHVLVRLRLVAPPGRALPHLSTTLWCSYPKKPAIFRVFFTFQRCARPPRPPYRGGWTKNKEMLVM